MGVIGLTGGIASGKTLVSDYMRELGVDIIDGDVITRRLYRPGGELLREIAAAFGDAYLLPDGELNRRAVRELVFADPEAKRKLEAIVNPAIYDAVVHDLLTSPRDHQLLVLPLLIEGGYAPLCDEIWLLRVDEREQIRRLTARDGVDEALAKAMIASQMPFAEKRKYAHRVIDNRGCPRKTLQRTKKSFFRFLKNFY